MNVRWASTLPVLFSLTLALAASPARAQGPMPALGGVGPAGPMPMTGGPPPGMMPGPMYPPPSPAYSPGQSFMGAPDMGGMGPSAFGGEGGGSHPPLDACNLCGGAGCPHCADGHGYGRPGGLFGHGLPAHGLFHDLFGWLGPYPDGGCAAPRWYDFSIEYVHLQRDNVSDQVNFTSAGIAGPIVLSTADLGFDESDSFRFSAMLQAGPGSNWEFTYFGLHFFDAQAAVADPTNDLFSVISDFGTLPAGGFDETDEADFSSIAYNSTFDNFELNFRQRWSAPNCRYQGSWLAGVRYFKLDEDFTYFTSSDQNLGVPTVTPETATFITDVNNSLTGAQIGGDVWICIIPGIKVGGDIKAGVYGNHVNVDNLIAVNTGAGPFTEEIVENDVAFVGEANLQALYRLSYNWTVKIGYQFLYVDGVALAPENFNSTPPALFIPPPGVNRIAAINDDADVFYHGATFGFEFLW